MASSATRTPSSTESGPDQANQSARRLISTSAAAALVDVSPRTLRRWIDQRLITGYRVGPRLLKVDPAELEALARPVDPA